MKKTFYDFCLEHGKEHLLVQWDTAGNLPDTPKTISHGSRKQAWWVCDQGHRWQAAVQSRTARDNQCPVCGGKQVLAGFNDLASRYPDLAAQWAQDLNGTLTPQMVTSGSAKRVWWRCDQDHVWAAKIYSRTGSQRSGCPICTGRYKKNRYRNALEVTPEGECR